MTNFCFFDNNKTCCHYWNEETKLPAKEVEMDVYRKPGLVSYKVPDVMEITGPAQSAYLDVGAGWRESESVAKVMEYRNEGISPEIRLTKAGIKTIHEVIG